MKNIKLLLSLSMILVVATFSQMNGMQTQEQRMQSFLNTQRDISAKGRDYWQGVMNSTQKNESMPSETKSYLIENAKMHRDNFQAQLDKLDILRHRGFYSIEEIQQAGQTFGQRY